MSAPRTTAPATTSIRSRAGRYARRGLALAALAVIVMYVLLVVWD